MLLIRCVAKCDFCPKNANVVQGFFNSEDEFKKNLKESGWKRYKSKKVKCPSCAGIDAQIRERLMDAGLPPPLPAKPRIGNLAHTLSSFPARLISKKQTQRHKATA